VTSGSYLLDTSAVIAIFNGDRGMLQWISDASEVYLCTVVAGELYYGAYKSARRKENIQKIEEFIVSSAVLESDINTAKEYGIIKSGLQRKGKPIPENDIWIAAIARQYGLTLVSTDRHFGEIDALNVLYPE